LKSHCKNVHGVNTIQARVKARELESAKQASEAGPSS
jgi:hypothetical protein